MIFRFPTRLLHSHLRSELIDEGHVRREVLLKRSFRSVVPRLSQKCLPGITEPKSHATHNWNLELCREGDCIRRSQGSLGGLRVYSKASPIIKTGQALWKEVAL